MTLLLIVLFALSVAVTVRDVRYRLVYGEDVILLVALRVLAAVFALYPEVSGLQPGRWGFGALATSALAALAAAVLFWALGWLVSHVLGNKALGGGDVLLLAACCLFVSIADLDLYFGLIALFGSAFALFWLLKKKSKTFPFAPALVWPCWLVVLLAEFI